MTYMVMAQAWGRGGHIHGHGMAWAWEGVGHGHGMWWHGLRRRWAPELDCNNHVQGHRMTMA